MLFRSIPKGLAWVDISITFVFATAVFLMVGISADVVAALTGRASPGALVMIGIALVAGLAATVLACGVAYYSAVATFRFGLDPDNHGIPISSSVMDLAGTICLVAAIILFGVTAHG